MFKNFFIYNNNKRKEKRIKFTMKNFLLPLHINQCLKLFFYKTIFNSPIFILKNELLKIPIFGWYLIKVGSISIERGKTTKKNINFFDKISRSINKTNRPLIIFPQGTRLNPEDRSDLKKVQAVYTMSLE